MITRKRNVGIVKVIFILFFFSFGNFFAQNNFVDSLFNNGNAAYRNKDYGKAVENYEKIINEGYASSELFYNLGNAYYKLGILGKAILNYERTLVIDPYNEDAKYNLKIANARITDKINSVPKFFLTKWKEALLNFFSIDFLTVAIVVLFTLLLYFIFIFRYGKTPSVRKLGFSSGSVVIFFLLFFSFVLYGKISQTKNEKYGIIISKEVTVRVSPDENAKAGFVIHEGTKAKIEDKIGKWLNIRLADGKEGWIIKDVFEPIEPFGTN